MSLKLRFPSFALFNILQKFISDFCHIYSINVSVYVNLFQRLFLYSSSSLFKAGVSYRGFPLIRANQKKSPISITKDKPPKVIIESDLISLTLRNCLSINISKLRLTILTSSIIREDWYNYTRFALIWQLSPP